MQLLFILIFGYCAWTDFQSNAVIPFFIQIIICAVLWVGYSIDEFHSTYKKNLKEIKNAKKD